MERHEMEHPARWPSREGEESEPLRSSLEDVALTVNDGPTELPDANTWQILAYALPYFSLQALNTIFTVYLTTYLTSDLGFSASEVPMLLIAAPLAGLMIAPVFAVLSDRSGNRMGYYAIGGLVMATSQFCLAWAREMSGGNAAAAKAMAFIAIYSGSVGAQAWIVGLRAMSAENIPARQQPTLNLWAGLASGAASVSVLASGFVRPSFRLVTVIGGAAVLSTISMPWLGRSSVPVTSPKKLAPAMSVRSVPKVVLAAIRNVPPITRRTCKTQVLSQFAWFPVLHYMSLYLSESYSAKQTTLASRSASSASSGAGVRVLLIGQIGALALQCVIARTWDSGFAPSSQPSAAQLQRRMLSDTLALRRIWAVSFVTLALSALGTVVFRSSFWPASVWGAGISAISPLSGWIPHALVSYEIAAVRQGRVGVESASSRDSSAAFFVVHEISITSGQILSTLVCGAISFGFERAGMSDSTAFLFVPVVAAALVAGVVC
ncbi:General alpha-glucoside permease [Colletotrichum orbiculare MAFF 240422]|uniref:General alpha-glucoside permease n=1 Tax=Colletotrichum orbiculare (strain 104-T / ATCC 96160 / CBS 514.97 / LARS 414 / MAFF 240422) TaxID=1213857 RepID=N4VGS6_COLOR|nr:General alpha-glucoside permease [Colletotrichum orbiculare MAFF 240422]